MPRASHFPARNDLLGRTDLALYAASLLASCVTAVLVIAFGPVVLHILDRNEPTAWLLIGAGSAAVLVGLHWIAASAARWWVRRRQR